MKKLSLTLLLCMLMIPMLLSGNTTGINKEKYSFSAVNAEGQTLYYLILSETDHTVALTLGENKYKDEKYIIPETVTHNGVIYTITEIEKQTFFRSNLTQIELNKGLKVIQKEVFLGCKITSITLHEGLKEIGDRAFCATLINTVVIPKSVTKIGEAAFAAIRTLQEISIPDQLHNIGINAFVGRTIFSNYVGKINSLPTWITSSNCLKYGISKEAVNFYYNTKLAQQQAPPTTPQIIYVQGNVNDKTLPNGGIPAQNTAISKERKVPSSDVDKNIPTNPTNNTNTFAIIIANEDYQEESQVAYALNDGEIFKTYCNKVLGLPEDNIHFRKNATLSNILSEIDWLANVAKAYKGEAKLIVYYAGHGIPDEASGSAYLLPVDGKGNLLATGYSLTNLYKTLGELSVKNITVFIDACFSGAQRNGKMLASARGVAIKTKPETPKGKMVVFSAAQGDETAYPYNDKEHGLFTYYLLKKLQETKGDVDYLELAEYIQQQVSRKSIVANGKSQTPTVLPSVSMGEGWKTMKLNR